MFRIDLAKKQIKKLALTCPRCRYTLERPHASICPRCMETIPQSTGCSGCGECVKK